MKNYNEIKNEATTTTFTYTKKVTFDYKNQKYQLTHCDASDVEEPRTWCDHVSIMVDFDKKFDFGDLQIDRDSDEADELQAKLYENNKVRDEFVVLPLYIYEHSGACLQTSKTDCFDSRFSGLLYCEVDKGMEFYGVKTKEELTQRLEQEVEIESEVWFENLLEDVDLAYVDEIETLNKRTGYKSVCTETEWITCVGQVINDKISDSLEMAADELGASVEEFENIEIFY